MMRVILGLFLIAMGIWGLFDEWYYVLDFLNGFLPIVMTLIGVLSLILFFFGHKLLREDVANDSKM